MRKRERRGRCSFSCRRRRIVSANDLFSNTREKSTPPRPGPVGRRRARVRAHLLSVRLSIIILHVKIFCAPTSQPPTGGPAQSTFYSIFLPRSLIVLQLTILPEPSFPQSVTLRPIE